MLKNPDAGEVASEKGCEVLFSTKKLCETHSATLSFVSMQKPVVLASIFLKKMNKKRFARYVD